VIPCVRDRLARVASQNTQNSALARPSVPGVGNDHGTAVGKCLVFDFSGEQKRAACCAVAHSTAMSSCLSGSLLRGGPFDQTPFKRRGMSRIRETHTRWSTSRRRRSASSHLIHHTKRSARVRKQTRERGTARQGNTNVFDSGNVNGRIRRSARESHTFLIRLPPHTGPDVVDLARSVRRGRHDLSGAHGLVGHSTLRPPRVGAACKRARRDLDGHVERYHTLAC
jgi:hypothetical protein